MNVPRRLKKWLAFGSGIGIAVEGPRGAESLRIQAVRVRPTGVRATGELTIENFTQVPAAEWGAAYAAFAGKLGLRQAAATVLLPRQDVILRQIQLPGVSDKDAGSAVDFQIDGLHPYEEGQVVSSWARLPGSDTVLVAIARAELISRYTTLFAEAGIALAGFTCSGPAVYSALRLFGAEPAPLLAIEPLTGSSIEVYGESPARPLLSAVFDVETERAVALASAELRFETPVEPVALGQLLKAPQILNAPAPFAYAAALSSACPHLSLPLNLLPEAQRQSVSPLRWAISGALVVAVAALAIGLYALPGYRNSRYLSDLDREIARLQPAATAAAALDEQIAEARRRTVLLDELHNRPRADMDVLATLTGLLEPPAWVDSLHVNPQLIEVTGQIGEAAPLLRRIDESPLFEGSEFTSPPQRGDAGESFRVRAKRSVVQTPPPAPAAPPAQPADPAAQPAAPPTPEAAK